MAQGAGMAGAPTIANITYFAVMAFFFIAAISQIGVATGLLDILFSAAVGGLSLALALAFGLGGRDAAARAINSLTGSINTTPSMMPPSVPPMPGPSVPPSTHR